MKLKCFLFGVTSLYITANYLVLCHSLSLFTKVGNSNMFVSSNRVVQITNLQIWKVFLETVNEYRHVALYLWCYSISFSNLATILREIFAGKICTKIKHLKFVHNIVHKMFIGTKNFHHRTLGMKIFRFETFSK